MLARWLCFDRQQLESSTTARQPDTTRSPGAHVGSVHFLRHRQIILQASAPLHTFFCVAFHQQAANPIENFELKTAQLHSIAVHFSTLCPIPSYNIESLQAFPEAATSNRPTATDSRPQPQPNGSPPRQASSTLVTAENTSN